MRASSRIAERTTGACLAAEARARARAARARRRRRPRPSRPITTSVGECSPSSATASSVEVVVPTTSTPMRVSTSGDRLQPERMLVYQQRRALVRCGTAFQRGRPSKVWDASWSLEEVIPDFGRFWKAGAVRRPTCTTSQRRGDVLDPRRLPLDFRTADAPARGTLGCSDGGGWPRPRAARGATVASISRQPEAPRDGPPGDQAGGPFRIVGERVPPATPGSPALLAAPRPRRLRPRCSSTAGRRARVSSSASAYSGGRESRSAGSSASATSRPSSCVGSGSPSR